MDLNNVHLDLIYPVKTDSHIAGVSFRLAFINYTPVSVSEVISTNNCLRNRRKCYKTKTNKKCISMQSHGDVLRVKCYDKT